MPEAVARRAIELAFSDGDGHGAGDGAERVQVSFFGGEPLLAWDLVVHATGLARAQAAARDREVVLTLTTNGTLLDAGRAAWLREAGFHVGLSIDGDREAHEATRPTRGGRSSFDQVARALDLCLEAGLRVETISVIDPANVDRIGRSVAWLAERGVARISLNPNFGARWTARDLDAWRAGYEEAAALYVARSRAGRPLYINVIEDKILTHVKGGYGEEDRCRMGRGAAAVAPSGNLYPCERMVGEDRDASLCIGHVDGGIDPARLEAIDRMRAETAIEASAGFGESGNAGEDCGGCALRRRCMSFCACANRAETGRIGEPGPVQCWHEQMLIEIADAAGRALWRARDRRFLLRIYGYDGPTALLPAPDDHDHDHDDEEATSCGE